LALLSSAESQARDDDALAPFFPREERVVHIGRGGDHAVDRGADLDLLSFGHVVCFGSFSQNLWQLADGEDARIAHPPIC